MGLVCSSMGVNQWIPKRACICEVAFYRKANDENIFGWKHFNDDDEIEMYMCALGHMGLNFNSNWYV